MPKTITPPDDRRAQLILAATIIEEVALGLDSSSKTCQCCGVSGKNNWAEWQTWQLLDGMMNRLMRLADSDAIRPSLQKTP